MEVAKEGVLTSDGRYIKEHPSHRLQKVIRDGARYQPMRKLPACGGGGSGGGREGEQRGQNAIHCA